MLASLSRRFQVGVRQFLAIWTEPASAPLRMTREIAAADQDESAAHARGDCRGVGRARKRKYQARVDGLRRELAARQARQFGQGVTS